MRITKDSVVRRNEILDVAGELFVKNGFDQTSTNEILEKVGIARGTLYYHFKSKEEIMDAYIERQGASMLLVSKGIASNKNHSVLERMMQVILSLNVEDHDSHILEHMHKPQNALIHQKIQKTMINGLTPIMTDLIKEGIEQGLFHTPYPYECTEMAITYASVVFDHDDVVPLTQEERNAHMQAFFYNWGRLLGAKECVFSSLAKQIALQNEI